MKYVNDWDSLFLNLGQKQFNVDLFCCFQLVSNENENKPCPQRLKYYLGIYILKVDNIIFVHFQIVGIDTFAKIDTV